MRPTTEEQATIDRLRKVVGDFLPDSYSDWEYERDKIVAARLALREHSDDDELPMTCQRLVDAGFFERTSPDWRYYDLGDITLGQMFSRNVPVEWVLFLCGSRAINSRVPATMGDVRRLCDALKIELKEPTCN